MLRTAEQMRNHLCIRQLKNRDVRPFPCKAPHCLAWRAAQEVLVEKVWCEDRDATIEPFRPAGMSPAWAWVPRKKTGLGVPAHWLEPEHEALNNTLGYCGLAGPVEHMRGGEL